jgi:hypothetical protein
MVTDMMGESLLIPDEEARSKAVIALKHAILTTPEKQ